MKWFTWARGRALTVAFTKAMQKPLRKPLFLKPIQLLSMNLKASTLVEMMIVMILSAIIVGFLFDGVELFRRYSKQITGQLMQNNELLTVTNWLTAITENSDSIRQDEDVKMYRKGAVQTILTISDSLLIINNDTLSIKVTAIEVRENPQADTLTIETEQLTLYFITRRKPDTEVITQIEKREYETTK